ncbi:energy-coupling factor ABC transporter permease [Aquihabitans sp. G128]|uniref:energy-coupling factor ABC transporter permease n=1 Tax=Aquihabitans sp. G128 TaxID=2849779 RepID=UPI001C215A6F|nr:energy-coupling factor ABC transporter permease [Aquihabitans sp. G128]QXC59179.1 energy-coupling factor ABC transporter permease [Aquihabitans sp. G128]
MHIPDGYVDLPTSVAGGVLAAAGVGVAARRAAIVVREKVTTLPAVVAAYLLVGQLLVVPVGFGTSAHLIGTGLATVLVGPAVAIVCVATVVVLQALVFADGGVTAIGLNIVNDGLVPALATAAVVKLLWPLVGRRRDRFAPLAGLASGLAALAGGLAAALVLVLGGTDVVSHRTVVATLGGAHVVVAVIEAVLTTGIVATVLRLRPDLVLLARPAATAIEADTAADAVAVAEPGPRGSGPTAEPEPIEPPAPVDRSPR